jgi:hypothetical protein
MIMYAKIVLSNRWCKIVDVFFCELQRKNVKKIFFAHRKCSDLVLMLFMFVVHRHAVDLT